jgi:hypothetical protein
MLNIYQRSYELPTPDKREILRYAGVRGVADEVEALLEECIFETSSLFHPRVCWCALPLAEAKQIQEISQIFTSSALLKHLEDCTQIVIFAATVGIEIDRAITRYNALSPAKALLASAIGSERIEALCDTFESALKIEGAEIRPRFSPGYSDLPIECQRDIFSLLDCPRRIGLTLTESMLMSPSKSVSAIIGIK